METLKAIAKRKSTRAFDPGKQITKADLDTILSAGSAAPVGAGDYQSIHLTIIQSRETLDKILGVAKAAFNMDRDMLCGAPTLIVVSSGEPKFPNIQYANVGCIMENILLAATDAGIDNLYLWGAVTAIARNLELMKELGIPDGFTPISAAALGYATESNSAEKELGITLSVNYI